MARSERWARQVVGADDDAPVQRLGRHANKEYWRVQWGGRGNSPVVVMAIAPDAPPEELTRGGPTGAFPFVDLHRYLSHIGVRVPAVWDWSQDEGYVVLEDLGDEMLIGRLERLEPLDRELLYQRAIDTLIAVQMESIRHPDPTCLAFQRCFDADLYQLEFDHVLEWALPASLPAAATRVVERHFAALAHRLAETGGPPVFTHRDFHSRNLMLAPDAVAAGRPDRGPVLAVIDFQDAILGHRLYDLVSLLRDSFIELDWPLVERLTGYYRGRLADAGGPELAKEPFDEMFDLLTIQRKLKDAARFEYLDRVRGNLDFRPFRRRAMGYVLPALKRRTELVELRQLFFPT